MLLLFLFSHCSAQMFHKPENISFSEDVDGVIQPPAPQAVFSKVPQEIEVYRNNTWPGAILPSCAAGPSFNTFFTWRNSSGLSPPMIVKPNPMVLFFKDVLISAPVSWDGSRVKTDLPSPLESKWTGKRYTHFPAEFSEWKRGFFNTWQQSCMQISHLEFPNLILEYQA